MDFIRRVGSSIQGAAQKGFAFAKKGADAVKNIYNKATHIPVIGNAIRSAGEAVKKMPLPYTGQTVGSALGKADAAITAGNNYFNRS